MTLSSAPFDRVVWVVLDGVGGGALPDAALFGDHGSSTLGNLSRAFHKSQGRDLALPNLAGLGLGRITVMQGVGTQGVRRGTAYGKALEQSCGKDTSSGHWEMGGVIVLKPFATFPDGFPSEVVNRWIKENNLPGILGNKAASGTEILVELGEEHVRTGKPILYTSADSVWQVAAHEETFGLERLYQICKSARVICDELQIGRVIARPFVGNPSQGQPFKRTYHRKDLSQPPIATTYLDYLLAQGVTTLGIGKISAIFGGRGVEKNIDTAGNQDGLRVLLEQADAFKRGLIFVNLIDFDMVFGHRRDVAGFGKALEDFDAVLPALHKKLGPRDLLILTADHGNDPTFHGTDHTREYAPILAFSPAFARREAVDLGVRGTFADMGATVAEALTGPPGANWTMAGKSFLPELMTP